MSTYYAILGLSMAAGGVLVDTVGARASWAIASGIFFVASVLAVVLTAALRETAPAERPGGLERIRVLMEEIDETRLHEQQRAAPERAVVAPRDAESRATP
jgi:hypothetical protein